MITEIALELPTLLALFFHMKLVQSYGALEAQDDVYIVVVSHTRTNICNSLLSMSITQRDFTTNFLNFLQCTWEQIFNFFAVQTGLFGIVIADTYHDPVLQGFHLLIHLPLEVVKAADLWCIPSRVFGVHYILISWNGLDPPAGPILTALTNTCPYFDLEDKVKVQEGSNVTIIMDLG